MKRSEAASRWTVAAGQCLAATGKGSGARWETCVLQPNPMQERTIQLTPEARR